MRENRKSMEPSSFPAKPPAGLGERAPAGNSESTLTAAGVETLVEPGSDGESAEVAARYSRQVRIAMLAGLAVILGCQLVTMAVLPLTDNTEGRYGSISRYMLESSDWLTPHVWGHGKLVPFWGKPPLFFWLAASSFQLLGVSEFAARLPSWLAGLGMIALTYRAAREFFSRDVAMLSILILGSSALYLGVTGLVALDAVASFCVAGIVVSYLLASQRDKSAWSYGVFVFLGLGMLAKGPVVVVLGCAPIVLHCAWGWRWQAFLRLPWLRGSVLATAIFLPWYILAERATPGFLEYFIVNEHIRRYLSAEYGDLHGTGHVRPYGTVWLMLAVGLLPWLPVLFGGRRPFWSRVRANLDRPGSPTRLILLWGLFPVVFFTFARSVLPTYVFPGVAGLAVLFAVELDRQLRQPQWRRSLRASIAFLSLAPIVALFVASSFADQTRYAWIVVMSLPIFVLAVLAWRSSSRAVLIAAVPMILALGCFLGLFAFRPLIEADTSMRQLVGRIDERVEGESPEIVLLGRGEASIDFYAPDRVVHLISPEDDRLPRYIQDREPRAFVIRTKNIKSLTDRYPMLRVFDTVGKFSLLEDGGAG